ncbi:MAG: hypothetical protein HGB32_10625, partial [Geobacteraceae bacterium]|nr:hypothetical protein [Geobacteraceae bacterium]
MNQSIKVSLGTIISLLTFSFSAWAYPVNVGDMVKMYNNDNSSVAYEGYYQTALKNPNGTYGSQFGVFCVEKDEYFTPGGVYSVNSISDSAYGGGVN